LLVRASPINALEGGITRCFAAGVGRGALVRGFESPSEIPRDFVEDWVAAEERKVTKERRWTLFWAIVGGVAGIIGVLVALLKS